MKKSYKIYIDKVVADKIDELPLSKINKGHAYNFIRILNKQSGKMYANKYCFVPMPYEYLRKVFGKNYKTNFVSALIDGGIVEIKDSYSTDKKFCKMYKVVKNLPFSSVSPLFSPFFPLPPPLSSRSSYLMSPVFSQNIDYQYFKGKKVGRIIKIKENLSNMDIEKDYLKNVSKLYVNYERIEAVIEKYVNSIKPNSFVINQAIKRNIIPIPNVSPKEEYTYFTKEKALEYARSLDKDLIEDFDGKIRLEDLYEFVYNKMECVTDSYLDALEFLFNKNFFGKRNETNNRFDSNITNFPSILLDIVKDDNCLIEIDLCNSQFAIFAHLIPDNIKGDDVELFKRLSGNCELYPYLQEKMSLNSRKEAKIVCFEVCFSHHKNNSEYMLKMRELFPNVMAWVRDYKKQNGDNQFAIMLQKKEAEIFIDELYPRIREEDIFCLTKHDSFIVKVEDELKVRNIMEEYFKEINFKAILK